MVRCSAYSDIVSGLSEWRMVGFAHGPTLRAALPVRWLAKLRWVPESRSASARWAVMLSKPRTNRALPVRRSGGRRQHALQVTMDLVPRPEAAEGSS